MHSSNRGLEFENEDSYLFSEAIEEFISEDSHEESVDPFYSNIVETQELNNESEVNEPFFIETIDLADAQIQQPPQEAPSEDKMCQDQTMCMPDIEPHQANVRHIESKGIGYNKGYTTLQALFSFSRGKYIPFIDLRGHVFNDGRLAANAGIGARYVFDPSKSMVGINTFYDYRNLRHTHFNQWGLGLEGFYDRWELRINGYLPVGKKRNVTDHHLNGISFKEFAGYSLWINESYTDKIISAKKGFDIEAGVHPFKAMRDYDCFVAAGPYYFGGEGKSSWGGKVRLKVEVAKYLFVELSDSYDKVFHNRFQGMLTLSLPFGGKKCYPKKTRGAATSDCFADNVMAWRGVQPVQRQEIIVAKKETKSYTIDPIAINPATGKPIVITFVNNQPSAFGNIGTFENPYTTLMSAQSNTTVGDIIYVLAGDGTSTGYDTGWILQEGQRFLGSAAAHDFQTTKGVVTVPIQTNIFPLISNNITPGPGISTVTGGTNYNEISGISCQQVLNFDAVVTTTQNIIIKNNLFISNSFSNQATVNVTALRNALIDNNIFINNSGNSGLFVQKDNVIAPAATANVTITNNIFTNNNMGIAIIAPGGATGILNFTIAGNVISDSSAGNGINIIFNSGSSPLTTYGTINSNIIYNCFLNGLSIAQIVPGTGHYNIFENKIFNIDAATGNVLFRTGSGNLCVNLHDNVSVANNALPAGPGYSFVNGGGTIFTEPFINNIGTISGTFTPVAPCTCGFCPGQSGD